MFVPADLLLILAFVEELCTVLSGLPCEATHVGARACQCYFVVEGDISLSSWVPFLTTLGRMGVRASAREHLCFASGVVRAQSRVLPMRTVCY